MDKSLNQQTYDRCKKDIMMLALKPGDMVSAAKLAERYNVSRTPARETLVRLHAEGMVDIFPQSKSMISRINVARVRQEWFVRRTLELGMVDAFFARVQPEDIEQMRSYEAALEELGRQTRTHETSYEYLNADNRFHAVTYRVAGETLAAEVIATKMVNYNRVRLLIDLDNAYKDRTVSDHEGLMHAIELGDKELYRTRLTEHLQRIDQDIEDISAQFPNMFE